jgi:hypothetical protein
MIIRLATAFLLLVLAGCAPRHTVVMQGNTVVLVLTAPESSQVGFASSLDQFTVHQALKAGPDQWIVKGLPNREFQYFYVVDGKVLLPECRYTVSDDFGSVNCRHLP